MESSSSLVEIVVPPYDGASIDEVTGQLLAYLLLWHRPRIVVEAGTYKGHFAQIAWESMLIHDPPHKISVFTADPVIYERTEIEGVTYIVDDFEQIAVLHPEIIGKVDFAFIDSGPPFADVFEEGVRIRHYNAAKTWMAPLGIIAVHDTRLRDKGWVGREQIVDEASVVLDEYRGLTLWQNK